MENVAAIARYSCRSRGEGISLSLSLSLCVCFDIIIFVYYFSVVLFLFFFFSSLENSVSGKFNGKFGIFNFRRERNEG